jgi:hypothetical protein
MKNLVFLIILLSIRVFCLGQELQSLDFYNNVEKAIQDNGWDSVVLKVTEYGDLGSESHYDIKVKKLNDEVKVSYYRQRGILKSLDTSFSISKNKLIQNLKEEVLAIQTRPVLLEATYKVILEQGGTNTYFKFTRGEGLYSIFCRNKVLK